MEITIDVINQILFLGFKVTVVIVPVAILLERSRNTSAANLHTLVLIVFLSLLVIPLSYFLFPNAPVKLLTGGVTTTLSGSELPHSSLQWAMGLVLLVYCLGVAAMLCSQLLGLVRLKQLKQDAHLVNDSVAIAALKASKKALGIPKQIILVQHKTIEVPMTWGITKTYIGLPQNFSEWGRAKLKRVLLHELSHIKRNDALVNIIIGVVEAVVWWVPTLNLLKTKIYWYREIACDDMVLAQGVDRTDYAQDLLDFTLQRGAPIGQAVALIDVSQNFNRIHTVLDGARVKTSNKVQWPIFALIVVVIFGLVGALKLEPMSPSLANRIIIWPVAGKPEAPAESKSTTQIDHKPAAMPTPWLEPVPEIKIIGMKQSFDMGLLSSHSLVQRQPVIELANSLGELKMTYDSPFQLIQQVTPTYPEKALKRGYEGKVEVTFDILPNGETTNIRITKADAKHIFTAPVLAATSQYIYQPRWANGQPVITRNVKEVFQFQIVEDAN